MLRTERQVALHDLLEALIAAANRYDDDVEVLPEGVLSELCQQLAQQRRRLGEALAIKLRDLGDLPTQPDTDRETLDRLGGRLLALLAPDEQALVVEKHLAAEAELERLASHAAQLAGEPDWQELLQKVRQSAAQAQMRMQELS